MVQPLLEDTDGSDKDIPVVLMPPAMKLEGKKSGKLRLVVMKGNIPQAEPAGDTSEGEGYGKQSGDIDTIRSRLKIFVRPAGLDAQGNAEVPSKLTWKKESSVGERFAFFNRSTDTLFSDSIAFVV
ncbi:molecular chaperone [Klebsiella oxytoca]|uniref:molecular chaperone n=1 Tax=Klebsiella oxytoca TaxID=571 RepID=UPI00190E6682|nr:molecular chaperone [Klebsiella oxytoca]